MRRDSIWKIRFGAWLAACCLGAAGLSSPAMAQQGWDQPIPEPEKKKGLTDPFEKALQLMAEGKCQEAMPILEAYAVLSTGNEVAELQIGQCLLALSSNQTSPDKVQAYADEGLGWILRAGDAGLRDAEEQLAAMYLDGRVLIPDPPEAGKWYLLWKRNVDPIGATDFDPHTMTLLNANLSDDDWTAAKALAKTWHPTVLGPAGQPEKP